MPSLRAPQESFEYLRRIMAITYSSIKIDPRWLVGELKGMDERGRQVIKTMNEIHRIEAEIYENRHKTNEEIMHENYLALTDQEDFINPYTNEVEQDTSEFRYRWIGLDGDIIYTNNPDYDPNISTHRTDFRVSTIRPR
ncbi:MAG TPA: hypothetical protein EYP57_08650 [Thermodesulfobacteriaceae bacterium]|nr:hypothetical protein [Thermodesulfobacteriaceae bacterium]